MVEEVDGERVGLGVIGIEKRDDGGFVRVVGIEDVLVFVMVDGLKEVVFGFRWSLLCLIFKGDFVIVVDVVI